MLEAIFDWWRFNFWFGAACLAASGTLVLPFLLSKRFRKWFSKSDIDLEAVGFIVLVVAVVAIGLYTTSGATAAPKDSFKPTSLRGTAYFWGYPHWFSGLKAALRE